MSDHPVNIPEEHLVEAARRGDRGACKALFLRFRDVAYRVAFRVTSHESDAMDVVQDSFVKAFAALDKLSDSGRFKSWFLRIVNNKALDLLRSRKVRKAMSIESNDDERGGFEIEDQQAEVPGEGVAGEDTQGRIREAIASLPPDQQTVITLYATGSLTYGEIAETLEIPLGTVMSRIYRARKLLSEWLPDLIPLAESSGKETAD